MKFLNLKEEAKKLKSMAEFSGIGVRGGFKNNKFIRVYKGGTNTRVHVLLCVGGFNG